MGDDQQATTPAGAPAQAQSFEPPLPKAMYSIANPVLKGILRSPLHGLISGALMLLTFRGRKTGRSYSIPVGYVQKSDRLLVFTHSGWWKNMRGGAAVTVQVRGKTIEGRAELAEDAQQIAEIRRDMVAKHGEQMARRIGIIGANPDAPPAAQGTKFIVITLAEKPR